jgi:hypothetical protein
MARLEPLTKYYAVNVLPQWPKKSLLIRVQKNSFNFAKKSFFSFSAKNAKNCKTTPQFEDHLR